LLKIKQLQQDVAMVLQTTGIELFSCVPSKFKISCHIANVAVLPPLQAIR
jgi:hypothetical protein